MSGEEKIMVMTVDGKQSVVTAKPKDFKTGSRGYFVFGKVMVGDKRYQMSGNLVEIGSKPKANKDETK